MSELTYLLEQVLPHAKFYARDETVYSSEEWLEAIARSRGRLHVAREVLSARPVIYDAQIGPLVDHLRYQLTAYIDPDTDRIGHSFTVMADEMRGLTFTDDLVDEIQAKSSLPNFARGLVRAAAVIGPERAARLLTQWANGEPLRYKIMVVLDGAFTDTEIELQEGLRAYQLPLTSNALPVSTPRLRSVEKILGRTLLEVDVSTGPALFITPEGDARIPLQTRTALGCTSFDTFLLALSLVCNRRVDVVSGWNDHGDAASFVPAGQSGSWTEPDSTHRPLGLASVSLTTGQTRLRSFESPPLNLDENGLRKAWELGTKLQGRMASQPRFKVAVTRWAKAASPGDLSPDRLIDLRVALEALYVDSDGGEVTFRLSVTGARHLATSLDKRREVRRSLSKFYGLASRVIHGRPLKENEKVAPVDRAATLCRDGILKVLQEGSPSNWTDFLLNG